MTSASWDERYSAPGRVWSGRPNPWLVELATSLSPATAADLGCGEGADAVWLAAHGWTVTAVDYSAAGLVRAREHAAESGVPVEWVHEDLTRWRPRQPFDLVPVQFFHAAPPERRDVHRRAWDATAGTLLVVGHDPAHDGGPRTT